MRQRASAALLSDAGGTCAGDLEAVLHQAELQAGRLTDASERGVQRSPNNKLMGRPKGSKDKKKRKPRSETK